MTALKKNDERGMGENVGAVTALAYATRKKLESGMGGNVGAVTVLEYATRKKIVERYGKKMSGSSQKYKLLVYVVFQCK